MTALLTGLGIGLAFWIVVIPTLLIVVRNNGDKNREDRERQIELMEERNRLDEEKVKTLWSICEALLREKS